MGGKFLAATANSQMRKDPKAIDVFATIANGTRASPNASCVGRVFRGRFYRAEGPISPLSVTSKVCAWRSTMSVQGTMTGKPLIESDRVEGTTVSSPQGNGSRQHQTSHDREDQRSGGLCRECPSVDSWAWARRSMQFHGQAHCDTNLGGYRTDITEQQLRGAPTSHGTATGTGVTVPGAATA